jgi:hypothetical protein
MKHTQFIQFLRKGKYHMKVFDRYKIRFTGHDPTFKVYALALWTMTVPATIIGIAYLSAAFTNFLMTSQDRSPAVLYGA